MHCPVKSLLDKQHWILFLSGWSSIFGIRRVKSLKIPDYPLLPLMWDFEVPPSSLGQRAKTSRKTDVVQCVSFNKLPAAVQCASGLQICSRFVKPMITCVWGFLHHVQICAVYRPNQSIKSLILHWNVFKSVTINAKKLEVLSFLLCSFLYNLVSTLPPMQADN